MAKVRYDALSPEQIADMIIDCLAKDVTIPEGLRAAAEQCGLGDLIKDPPHDQKDPSED